MDNEGALIIGGSAGSLDVLMKVLPDIQQAIAFPVIIVVHRKNAYDSKLTQLLASRTKMTVKEVEEKEPILGGHVYLAPPDYHVLIEQNKTFSLDYSEKVNFSRPAIDVTFQTAAEVYKNKLVCILLSGSSADGVAGLRVAKEMGGTVVAQEPTTACFGYMPEQAALNVQLDKVLRIEEMAKFINEL